jgi:tetratricopeptide (TPR) repeat protein
MRKFNIAFFTSCVLLAISLSVSLKAAEVNDEVIFKSKKTGNDGLTVYGRIDEVTETKLWIILTESGTERGRISIPADRINRIEYDLAGRRAELQFGDNKALYQFALWELSLGKEAEAAIDLEAVVGKPGIPVEAFFILAGLHRKAGQLAPALAAYRAYLHAKPKDEKKAALATKAIKELAPLVKTIAKTVPVKPNPANGGKNNPTGKPNLKPPPKRNKPAIPEGLETRKGWSALPWADAATVSLQSDKKSGNKYLALQMSGTGRSAGNKSGLQLQVPRARLVSSKLIFNIYNPDGKSLPVSVAFQTGKSKTYYESRTFRFNKKGWHQAKIDLNGKNFKAASTSWSYRTAIKDKDNLQGIIILINKRAKMTVCLDYIKFVN